MIKAVFSLGLLVLASAACALSASPFDAYSQEQKDKMIEGDTVFVPSRLSLKNLPRPDGPQKVLFDGRSLRGWDIWLGLPDSDTTYKPHGRPIGLNRDTTETVSVVQEDEAPAMRISGQPWGGPITKKSYGNYHLRLQYKWGKIHSATIPRNNGILYHSYGAYGAFFDTWMRGVEFEIVGKLVGAVEMVPAGTANDGALAVDYDTQGSVRIGQDCSIPYPYRRFMPNGVRRPVAAPMVIVSPAVDAEKPVGEWNTLDLYVYRDRAVHVVNGIPVAAVENLTARDSKGKTRPLTTGRIQLQSESAETFFRNITITPIKHLPDIVSSPD